MSIRRVFTEPDPMLKEIPMFSSDEVPIELNSVLYRVNWSSGYGFKSKGKTEIEALRVFFVNNSARQFRVKCMKGCEEIFKYADGCSNTRLYGKFENALAAIRDTIEGDVQAAAKKMDDVRSTIDHLNRDDARVRKMKLADVKVPKAVKV